MFRVRQRVNTLVERGVLAAGWLRADDSRVWAGCRRVVFVCSGNICRSPYAEVVTRDRGITAISCGTDTRPGLPADASAIAAAARRGVDLSLHQTTRWQDVQIADGDVIVAMQLKHARQVFSRARETRSPVVLMSALLPRFRPILDPYGRPAQEFDRVFGLIDAGADGIAARIGDAARQ